MIRTQTTRTFAASLVALAASAGATFAQDNGDTETGNACAKLEELISELENPEALHESIRAHIESGAEEDCQIVLNDHEAAGGLQGLRLGDDSASNGAEDGEVDSSPYVTAAQGSQEPQADEAAARDAGLSAMSAEDLSGKAVHDGSGERLGTIEDVLSDLSGEAQLVVVNIGDHSAAVPLSELSMDTDSEEETRISTELTEDDLRAMPAYDG